MPNTPALVRAGATAICGNAAPAPATSRLARALFEGVGTGLEAPHEALLDAVTGLSGSGPAYVFVLLEALARRGRARRPAARGAPSQLALQTVLGAAALALETPAPAGRAERPGHLARRHHARGARAPGGRCALPRGRSKAVAPPPSAPGSSGARSEASERAVPPRDSRRLRPTCLPRAAKAARRTADAHHAARHPQSQLPAAAWAATTAKRSTPSCAWSRRTTRRRCATRRRSCETRSASSKSACEELSTNEKLLQETLTTAQQLADELKRTAIKEAEVLRRRGRAQGREDARCGAPARRAARRGHPRDATAAHAARDLACAPRSSGTSRCSSASPRAARTIPSSKAGWRTSGARPGRPSPRRRPDAANWRSPASRRREALAMPVYEYACEKCGHEFEAEQRITDRRSRPARSAARARSSG